MYVGGFKAPLEILWFPQATYKHAAAIYPAGGLPLTRTGVCEESARRRGSDYENGQARSWVKRAVERWAFSALAARVGGSESC